MSHSDSMFRRPGSGERLPPLNTKSDSYDTTYEKKTSTVALVNSELLSCSVSDSELENTGRMKKSSAHNVRTEENGSWSNQCNYAQTGLTSIPVRNSGHETAIALSSDANKPKFLLNLENYLVKELDALGIHEGTPHSKWSDESRLQAHREVFQYLIEDFRSYRPLLSAIKNEYEMMVKYQSDYIRQLEPLQQMLITVTEQCDVEIMKIRDGQNAEVARVQGENSALQSYIDGIRNQQFSLETQVQRLKQRLEEQYDRFRSEADARKLLVSDINDLKIQQEELIQQQHEANNKDKSEDPVVIRQNLRKAREDEKVATDKINDIIANYGDVIPKSDYESLSEKYSEVNLKTETKTAEMEKLKAEHDELLDTHRQVIKMRDELYQESERLRQTATPRPDWNRCTQVVSGGADRWQTLAAEKSSDQLVGVLLNELAGTGSNLKLADYFPGQGLSDDVPVHLRYEGEIKNRRIARRDAALLIKDMWKEKDDSMPQEGNKGISLSQFVINYLKSKFPNDTEMAYEWSYNLENACQRYVNDERIKMFYAILCGRIDEQLYFIQLQYIVALLKLLSREAPQAEEGQDAAAPEEAKFHPEEFKQLLSEYFNGEITDEQLDKLVTAAVNELADPEAPPPETEPPEPSIEFMRLFFEDDEGKFGPFVDELKKLLEELRVRYIDKIIDLLPPSPESEEEDTISPTDLEAAIYNNDTQLDTGVIENLLFGTYGVNDREELEVCPAITKPAIRDYLLSRHIKPVVSLTM